MNGGKGEASRNPPRRRRSRYRSRLRQISFVLGGKEIDNDDEDEDDNDFLSSCDRWGAILCSRPYPRARVGGSGGGRCLDAASPETSPKIPRAMPTPMARIPAQRRSALLAAGSGIW
jgi:hypothetical protein